MKIGLDFDGVITNLGKLKQTAATKLFSKTIPGHHLESAFIKANSADVEITLADYRLLQNKIFETAEFLADMEMMADALTVITEWQNLHTLSVITSRAGDSLAMAETWAAEQGLTLPFTGVGYGVSKLEAARGLDIYIDDDLEKLLPLIGTVPQLFLFDSSGSVTEVPAGITVVTCWSDFAQLVESLSNQES